MKVTIDKIEISDDGFNAPGFMTISIGEEEFDIHVNELYPAIKVFKEKYLDDLKADKLLK